MEDDRNKMEKLREWAQKRETKVRAPIWKRAYLHLADAADRIAAMEARTEDTEQ